MRKEHLFENDSIDLKNLWFYGIIFIVINTLLAWVRHLSKFKFIFLFANILVILTISVASYYSITKLMADGVGPNV